VQPSSAAPGDPDPPVVFVVDDDDGMRAALRRRLVLAGFVVEPFASGADFLAGADLARAGCILLDVSMPGMSGLEVQAALKQRRVALPIIFLTGHADIPSAVTAMREGAVDFIEKPFDDAHLIERVRQAIGHARHLRAQAEERRAVLGRMNTLTPRERQVLDLVALGKTNKEIARLLGASHRTIEIHRSHLMEKMAAATLADLVRMQLLLKADPPAG
jgi:FixJ family two-component response regulator